MKISENELFENRFEETLQTYKNNKLFVGDVWQNEVGTKGIIYFVFEPDGSKKYILLKENGKQHYLPEEKAGFGDAERIGNVCDSEDLMKIFVEKNIIIKENKSMEEKQEKKKTPKKQDKAEEKQEKMCLMGKINQIRLEWSKIKIEKEGLGKAGGGAKYEYYKPQQIIDFCLEKEAKYGLFSDFDTVRNLDGITTHCFYRVTDIDSKETKEVSCPFEIPTKMAASQAQQVGAALTYYNRRLAMLMYKIEDNSKESVEVLNDADYTEKELPNVVEIPEPPKEIVVEVPQPHEEISVETTPPKIEEEKASENSQDVYNLPPLEYPIKDKKEEVVITPPPVTIEVPVDNNKVEVEVQEETTNSFKNLEDLY